MKKIQHNTEAIYITSRGFNIDYNNASYTVTTTLNSLPKAVEIFGSTFTMVDENTFISGGFTDIPNLPDIIDDYALEQEDVGKKVDVAMNIFGTNIIWLMNSLKLNQEDWTLTD